MTGGEEIRAAKERGKEGENQGEGALRGGHQAGRQAGQQGVGGSSGAGRIGVVVLWRRGSPVGRRSVLAGGHALVDLVQPLGLLEARYLVVRREACQGVTKGGLASRERP